jgi:hypothetical protein
MSILGLRCEPIKFVFIWVGLRHTCLHVMDDHSREDVVMCTNKMQTLDKNNLHI